MSKLESAFSKALKERSELEARTALNKQVDGAPSTQVPVADSTAASDLGVSGPSGENQKVGRPLPSKQQIKRMAQGRILSNSELAKRRIVHPKMKDSNLLNVYRNLRTNLLSKTGTKNFTIMTTSVVPGGGSSLISANIAATFALDEGKTALLIEGNVHQPSLEKLFDTEDASGEPRTGLMDYLESDDLSVSDIIHETGIPRLRFIPVGNRSEDTTEHFTSAKMAQFLKEISERYPDRYPIIDAPSIMDSADARILVELCDQVILVIPYGLCSEEDIRKSVDGIGSEKLTGVVLNQF